jgi:hypothetical protein
MAYSLVTALQWMIVKIVYVVCNIAVCIHVRVAYSLVRWVDLSTTTSVAADVALLASV